MEFILGIAIIFGCGDPNCQPRPPAHYEEQMPTLEICMDEAKRFLEAEFPETKDAVAIQAACRKMNPHEQKISK